MEYLASLPMALFTLSPMSVSLPMKAEPLADFLMEDAGVATLPGSAFGIHADNHLRMCFANSTENLERALDRISEAVGKLPN